MLWKTLLIVICQKFKMKSNALKNNTIITTKLSKTKTQELMFKHKRKYKHKHQHKNKLLYKHKHKLLLIKQLQLFQALMEKMIIQSFMTCQAKTILKQVIKI